MTKTRHKPRQYDTLWWKQRVAPHQVAAHQAIQNLEAAIEILKNTRDEPVQEAIGTNQVTMAGMAMRSIMIALDALWPHVEPAQVPRAEPGIFAEVQGARLYQRILAAQEAK